MNLQVVLVISCCFFGINAFGWPWADFHFRPDASLSPLEIIRKYGYPAESHTVETADGYLLELHRIPHGKWHHGRQWHKAHALKKKFPVFFVHGEIGSSMDFLFPGPNRALPYLLVDLGFDVWLGNVRGNTYSRRHLILSPNEKLFWNFSLHESAIYDLPAEIDYVRNFTQQEKVIYIGYSMGTTLFFMMTSTLPEYNDKIAVALQMGVKVYLRNTKSPVLRLVSLFSKPITDFYDLFSYGEVLPQSETRSNLIQLVFGTSQLGRALFLSVVFSVVGYDYKMFDERLFDNFFSHYPSGCSVKVFNHFVQMEKSGRFRQYDYGAEGNVRQYGSPEPPSYDLRRVTTPMYFYQGKNDYVSTLEDLEGLISQLKDLRGLRVIDYPKFNHFDFMVSRNVKEQVFEILIDDLIYFLKNYGHNTIYYSLDDDHK